MKKLYFLTSIILSTLTVSAQDTIIGFNFPSTDTAVSLHANYGKLNNLGRCFYFYNNDVRVQDLQMKTGNLSQAIQRVGWDNGALTKYWMIAFNVTGYANITISSKQQAGGTKPGPKYFKLQYKVSDAGTWTDVPNGNITCANDWTTSALNSLPLPSECDNSSSIIYVRWLMTSNESINGPAVAADGPSKIDEVFVRGTISTGISTLNISSISMMTDNHQLFLNNIPSNSSVQLFSIDGRLIYSANNVVGTTIISTNNESLGLYIIRISNNASAILTKKIMF